MEIINVNKPSMPEQVQANTENIKLLAKQISEINDFNFMGEWIINNEYKVNDIVTYNNSIYVVIQDIDNSTIPPSQDIQHFYLTITSPSGSNPNLLINGDFRVNQRGDSVYTTGFTVDRWRISSPCTVTPLINGGVNILTTGNADALFYRMEVEDFEMIRGKTCTVSMKCSEITMGQIDVQVGDSSIDWLSQIESQGLKSDGIFKMTFNVPINATATTKITIHTTDATNVNVEWIKLEIGSVATEYSARPYAKELAMCQRYYEKIDTSIQGNNYNIFARVLNTNYLYNSLVNFVVEKRAKPTVNIYSTNNTQGYLLQVGSQDEKSVSANYITTKTFNISITNNDAVANSVLGGYFEADAEIY